MGKRLGAVFFCAVLAASGGATADDTLSSIIQSVCGAPGAATLPDDLKARCDAARMSALEQATQAGALSLTPATSLATSMSETLALKQKVELVKSVMALDATAVATIKPTTVTVPDMSAASLARFRAGLAPDAAEAAKAVHAALQAAAADPAQCKAGPGGAPRLVVLTSELADLRKNYVSAVDSVSLLQSQMDRYAELLDAAYKDPTGGAKGTPSFTSLTAALAGAGLVVDLVGKSAALAASFRPALSTASGTVTGDIQQAARATLVEALVARQVPVYNVDTTLPAAQGAGPDTLRGKLSTLRDSALRLQQKLGAVGEYDYVREAARVPVEVPLKDDAGRKLDKQALEERRKAERDRLTARAQARQASLAKAVATGAALVAASDELNATLLVGKAAKDQAAATPPLAIDQWELLRSSEPCLYTLVLPAPSALVDRLAIQRAFGAPDYQFLLTGLQPWTLASSQGRIVAAGTLASATDWKKYGPSR